eukprot:90825-Prorocentrum_minimum.AAC.1
MALGAHRVQHPRRFPVAFLDGATHIHHLIPSPLAGLQPHMRQRSIPPGDVSPPPGDVRGVRAQAEL